MPTSTRNAVFGVVVALATAAVTPIEGCAPGHRTIGAVAPEGGNGGNTPQAGAGGSPLGGRDGGTTDAPVTGEPKDAGAKDVPVVQDTRVDPPDMRPAPDLRAPLPMNGEAPPLGDNALAQWKFDEGFGNTAADSTKNNNVATLKAGKLDWVEGKHGWAAKLSGGATLEVKRSDSIDATATTNRITVSAWIYPTVVPDADIAFITSRQEGMTGYEIFGLSLWNGAPAFDIHFQLARATNPVPANQWVHVAGVYDGAFIRIYVNGVEAGTNDEVLTIPADPNPVRISGNVNTVDAGMNEKQFFDGYIDDLRIYNRALTAQEIADIAK